MMKLDILAFGAHPDDVEIGMGATLAQYSANGYKIGICDLTKAELSSNGTVEIRQKEAKAASTILGITTRVQMEIQDRGLKYITQMELAEVVSVIREYRPTFVFAPYEKDRHPDHGACASIIREAVFNAGIKNYQCARRIEAHRTDDLFYYFINGYEHPDFVIDVSNEMEQKVNALQAYKSQFTSTAQSISTPLTDDYIASVKARERLFGKEVGVKFAEGFITSKPLILSDLFNRQGTNDEA
ncbi:bacillithiol biosynthesis deacetylase BshB1 [Halalkalibacter krulwichiae]|uniref:Mycothiol S-conjugate amidase n=1 Tax=Halalkalibacter krulwichiae TaxID=199441 RepID=A0A1X9MA99_9BACI|nr:bacillithiol biosynthesis deacetylase BshB1 [Halalkalibacter krulwichiae]ARK30336.1 Mycothiol S-conjugate amidase [Halalkalibacter krulwichiae]